MVMSDERDVAKNEPKKHFLLTSSISETRSPGIEVDNYKTSAISKGKEDGGTLLPFSLNGKIMLYEGKILSENAIS